MGPSPGGRCCAELACEDQAERRVEDPVGKQVALQVDLCEADQPRGPGQSGRQVRLQADVGDHRHPCRGAGDLDEQRPDRDSLRAVPAAASLPEPGEDRDQVDRPEDGVAPIALGAGQDAATIRHPGSDSDLGGAI